VHEGHNNINIDKELELTFYEGCVQGKQHKETLSNETTSCTYKKLGLNHSNVWGIVKTSFFNGAKYFITFMDNVFDKSFVYTLRNKTKCF
jgi:hypothetical protein